MPPPLFKNLKLALFAGLFFFASCVTDGIDEITPDLPATQQTEDENGYWTGPEFSSDYKSSPDAIYSLRNVQKAFDLVAGEVRTRAFTLEPTHKYVRCLPQDTTDIYILMDSLDLDLMTFPIDRELTEEEMNRHENTKFNGYAWQYGVFDVDFPLPAEMEWELLDYAYLQPDDEETMTRSGESYQLAPDVYYDIITKSMELTGKAAPETRAAWQPSATVQHTNPATGSGLVPVVGVHVRANTDFNSGNGYTNSEGKVTIAKGWGGKFRNPVTYMVIWENNGTFKIHDSAGKAKSKRASRLRGHWAFTIPNTFNFNSFCATIYRGLKEYYSPKTGTAVSGLTKISSVNVREHWGETYEVALGDYRAGYFNKGLQPNKIHIFSKGTSNFDLDYIYETTFHELGHASHYQNVKNRFSSDVFYGAAETKLKETWAMGIQYAYMRLYIPDYRQFNHDNEYTAIVPSLMNRGITLTQLQTIMTRSGVKTLEQCRPMVKNLTIIPATVDMIFDNPTTLY